MPSRSLFAKRSSTRSPRVVAPGLVGATLIAAAVGIAGFVLSNHILTGLGLFAALVLASLLAATLFVSERRRHGAAEDELQAHATLLEALVESIGRLSATLDPSEILDRTSTEAKRLFAADSVELRHGATGEARLREGGMDAPLAVRGDPVGMLEIDRRAPFGRDDRVRPPVLAACAARAFETARRVEDAGDREAARERLTDRLISAEQDERRRLSVWLHDGPLSTMSGVALMHDAALAAIEDGRLDDAAKVVSAALDRERETIRTLRDLSHALEPLVLRDQGFAAAVGAVAEQAERRNRIAVSVDAAAGERLAEKAQIELYQVIREAMAQAVRRRPGRIELSLRERDEGEFELLVVDDGFDEKRRASIEAIEERARVLNARFAFDQLPEGGTRVQVVLPAYVAAAGESGL